MSKAIIRIDPYEEVALICRLLYYQPNGYFSNANKLRDACKKEGYIFKLSTVKKWLSRQSIWQIYKSPPKYIPRVSYGKISHLNCVHQTDILFLTHDQYKSKKRIAVLNIIDMASRFKASVPLTSKKSSEVAKAFKKIYNNPNNPLTWPRLLQCDGGREFMGKTSRLMQKHNVAIRVTGAYGH
jgi:hypothetical protein